jgi:hypothetical protein
MTSGSLGLPMNRTCFLYSPQSGLGARVVRSPVQGRDAEHERLLPYVCFDECRGRSDVCPRMPGFASQCNESWDACMIHCDRGCPDDTMELKVNEGCICFAAGVQGGLDTPCCSTGSCGAPWFLPCCSGVCRAGRCE